MASSVGSTNRTADLRQRMVEEQLRRRGLCDERVLAVMGEIPREEFVPTEYRDAAYDDRALPIGHEQTISQPYTAAYMCEALNLTGDEKVLEVGTGSGYGAAVLSRLAREVHTVERIAELAHSAQERLSALGFDNVYVHVGDGTLGWPEAAPYDAMIVTAGARDLPQVYCEQLVDGGRIVIPLGPTPHSQRMWRFVCKGGKLHSEDLGAFAFVPLIGTWGWKFAER